MRALALVIAALSLAGCAKPVVTVCSTPRSCVVNFYTCTAGQACQATPLEIKGAVP
jgi:hypothetical protein